MVVGGQISGNNRIGVQLALSSRKGKLIANFKTDSQTWYDQPNVDGSPANDENGNNLNLHFPHVGYQKGTSDDLVFNMFTFPFIVRLSLFIQFWWLKVSVFFDSLFSQGGWAHDCGNDQFWWRSAIKSETFQVKAKPLIWGPLLI